MQPVKEIAWVVRDKGVLFHTDAVQSVGCCSLDVNRSGVDTLSFSAHKFYGPKGVGVLYKRGGVKLALWLSGGSQEGGMRAGTHLEEGWAGASSCFLC